MAQYYTKPQPVDAWQYNGNIKLTELPGWVADLIAHHNFGYHEAGTWNEHGPFTKATQYFDGTNWVLVVEGDWLVRYDEYTISVVSDEKFKESFEKAELRSITTTIVK